MAITRAAGSTSEILNIYFRDNRNVSSFGMANVSASSIAFSWCRDNQATQSSGLCSSQTVLGTYSTASLTQISSTSTLGWYQFGLDNGALASGRSVVVHLWSKTSTAGLTSYSVEIDLLGNINPVSVSSASVDFGVSTIAVAQKLVGVSTMTTPVGVSSASVNLGVSTLAASVSSVTGSVNVSSASVNLGVSTLATSVSSVTGSVNISSYSREVGVSSYSREVGVSSIQVAEKLVGVSTIAASQKLVGVSTMTTPVGVSSASVDFGVSTIAVSQKLVGVSTMATPVGVSSASVDFGVSTLAVSEKFVGVSTLATEVGVSSSVMVSSNIVQVNNVAVQGAGTQADSWRPV